MVGNITDVIYAFIECTVNSIHYLKEKLSNENIAFSTHTCIYVSHALAFYHFSPHDCQVSGFKYFHKIIDINYWFSKDWK